MEIPANKELVLEEFLDLQRSLETEFFIIKDRLFDKAKKVINHTLVEKTDA